MTGFNITWSEYPQINLTGGFANMTAYVNNVTSGYFGIGILMSIWVILFLLFKREGTMEGFLAASFITTVLAAFFYAMNIATGVPLIIGIMVTGLAFLVMNKRTG